MVKQNGLIKSWNGIYDAQPIIIKIIGQNFWPWQSLPITNTFVYKLWFAPKFDIQSVNKLMNPTIEDWAMWLSHELEFNFYLTLKKCKDGTRKMLMNVKKNNAASRLKPRFGLNDNISKQQGHHRSFGQNFAPQPCYVIFMFSQ
jgi:hypothetical protein